MTNYLNDSSKIEQNRTHYSFLLSMKWSTVQLNPKNNELANEHK